MWIFAGDQKESVKDEDEEDEVQGVIFSELKCVRKSIYTHCCSQMLNDAGEASCITKNRLRVSLMLNTSVSVSQEVVPGLALRSQQF